MGDPSFTSPSARTNGDLEIVSPNDLDLRQLAEQLTHIATQLRSGRDLLADDGHGNSFPAPVEEPGPQSEAGRQSVRLRYAQIARSLYLSRRRRENIFGNAELFGEPAWDILLDLYVAYAERKKVSVSSACIGSAAPSTTGLRWLGILSEQDLVTREHDPDDQRRVLVKLSQKGLEAMDRYFATAAAAAAAAA